LNSKLYPFAMGQTSSALAVAGTGVILFSTKDVLNFQKQFVAYAIFHQNHKNKICHEICVWPIFWSFLAMFHNTDAVVPRLPFTNHAFFVTTIYLGLYKSMKWGPLQGTGFGRTAMALTAASWASSGLFAKLLPGTSAKWAAVVNAIAWVAQFYTHAYHEGKAPALLKNPAQAFLFAPLFVLSEGLVDRGIGDYPARVAEMQPAVMEGLRLLKAGKWDAENQLKFKPLVVALGVLFALFLMRTSRSSGASKTDAKLKQETQAMRASQSGGHPLRTLLDAPIAELCEDKAGVIEK
jgi:uncharacterized membrane protein YGL010W